MPSFKIYSFADFGVSDDSFVWTRGATMTLGASTTQDNLLIVDDDNFLDPDSANDPDQVLAADLYVDGTLVGSAGDSVTISGYGYPVIPYGSGTLQFNLATISVNGMPIGFASGWSIPPGVEMRNSVVAGEVSVNYNQFRCFTKGTLLLCENGEFPVESLQKGDLVHTRDHGFQPVRWVYSQTVSGRGPFAPICFKAGAVGNLTELVVSPMHRMLVQGSHAEVLLGRSTFLAHAKDLCNGRDIFPKPCAQTTYYHLLFDQHELVSAHGCWSESFAATCDALDGMEQAVKDELFAIFPHLGKAWRDALPTLSSPEVELLSRLGPYNAVITASVMKCKKPKRDIE